MLAAQLGHRHTALSLTQDRKDLRLSLSACLHSESPRSSCRENSTFAAPHFRGDYPYDRIVDVMEELVKFTLLTRDRAGYLVDRYSERKESAEALMKRVNLSAAI